MWSTNIFNPQRFTSQKPFTTSNRATPLEEDRRLRPNGLNFFLMIMQNHLETIYIAADDRKYKKRTASPYLTFSTLISISTTSSADVGDGQWERSWFLFKRMMYHLLPRTVLNTGAHRVTSNYSAILITLIMCLCVLISRMIVDSLSFLLTFGSTSLQNRRTPTQ